MESERVRGGLLFLMKVEEEVGRDTVEYEYEEEEERLYEMEVENEGFGVLNGSLI